MKRRVINEKVLNWRELLKEWKEITKKEKKGEIVREDKKEFLLIAMKEAILNVWEKTNFEPFYARFVIRSRMITGLVIEWKIDEDKMKIKLIQERLENDKIIPKKKKIEIKIEEVEDVVLFKTKNGKIL
jgi:hypothetical protein